MVSKLIFGDQGSDDFGMRIEKMPAQNAPARRRRTHTVAGRNGVLHESEESFENYIRPYRCYFHGDLPTPQQAHAVKAWLLHSGVPQILRDTYDPMHYYLATFSGPLDIENILNKYGRCVINFDCGPQAFLLSGDEVTFYETPGMIFNPTQFRAKPVIKVYGNGAGTVTVGNATVRINSVQDQVILDCERQDAYRHLGEGTPENCNSNIYAISFPELLPGENIVSFTGDIDRVEIQPRWWEL